MLAYHQNQLADYLRIAKGTRSLNAFAQEAGVSGSYLSRLMRGLVASPPEAGTLRKIAAAANGTVTYEQFMLAAGHLGNAEFSSFTYPVGGNRSDQTHLIAENPPSSYTSHYIPVFERLEAGNYALPASSFRYKADDDRLSGSRILSGDMVLIEPGTEYRDGDIVLVHIGTHDAELRRLREVEGHLLLLTDDPLIIPIVTTREAITVVGRAVQVIIDLQQVNK
ncbi:helix-turn-helix domain-containing protein [Paenibacillus gansuensis]|uniref:Helix-turn-helix domain-containing protein n=1 Tax=Paenibacillus gansuensis TaxID=306542 RepID=A0ABW5P7W2_9BACL